MHRAIRIAMFGVATCLALFVPSPVGAAVGEPASMPGRVRTIERALQDRWSAERAELCEAVRIAREPGRKGRGKGRAQPPTEHSEIWPTDGASTSASVCRQAERRNAPWRIHCHSFC